jgi:hypothetical protein
MLRPGLQMIVDSISRLWDFLFRVNSVPTLPTLARRSKENEFNHRRRLANTVEFENRLPLGHTGFLSQRPTQIALN